jgi:basic amino acid/polyamine antiporter, APA family
MRHDRYGPQEGANVVAASPVDDGAGHGELRRALGVGDAVVIGLGSMLGAGVFAAFGPAARAAGAWLLPALVIAGAIAYCNATSSAALAARYPRAGGAYLYGRARLGPGWGFLAGWAFVVGKTASCAAMALTAGAYAWPEHPRLPAAAAVIGLTVVNSRGVAKTARLTRWLVGATILVLCLVVLASLAGGAADVGRLRGGPSHGVGGVLQAAGLLFFAFAGYARIATLGEEVRDPARTIPRAVPLALGLVLGIYLSVGVAILLVLGADGVAATPVPLEAAVRAGSFHGAGIVVRLGAITACLGVLLSAMAGVARTTLAMSRDRELPIVLAAVHPRFGVPHRADIALGTVVTAVILAFDVRGAIGFAGVGVLVYYAIANAAAWTLDGPERARLRPVAVAGLVGSLTLAAALPGRVVCSGLTVLAAGLTLRALARLRSTRLP